jgi:hypothetical protein
MTDEHNQQPPAGEVAELKEEVAVLTEEVEVLEELIDLEEWAKAGKEPKKAKRYRIRIDKERYVVEVHSMDGRQILALADKTPEKYQLSQKLHGGVIEPVDPDQVVVFHVHKVERFQTVARDCTEG